MRRDLATPDWPFYSDSFLRPRRGNLPLFEFENNTVFEGGMDADAAFNMRKRFVSHNYTYTGCVMHNDCDRVARILYVISTHF